MTLGQRIQQLRTSAGLSQEELAEKLSTTRQAVSKWELDAALPELSKIVRISRLFSVTTDSLLIDGITTFDLTTEQFSCGIYRAKDCEIVETEKFAYVIYSADGGNVMGAKLYSGIYDKKTLCAVCERDTAKNATKYAYKCDDTVIGNDSGLAELLGEKYDPLRKKSMKRLKKFFVDHSKKSLPKVSESGIKGSLLSWRMRSQYRVFDNEMSFTLCTSKTEYVFSIRPQDDNIYCGASNNIVFEMGLMGGRQYFRLRNYKNNTEAFCRFYCDFSYIPDPDYKPAIINIGEKSPQCFADEKNIWLVKRYNDDEIVLQGCGGDEYFYHRENSNTNELLCE